MPTPNRLAGHELWSEGAAIEGRNRYDRVRDGRGECSCGALSPTLPSDARRKQWHRDHKNDIRSELGLARMDADSTARSVP